MRSSTTRTSSGSGRRQPRAAHDIETTSRAESDFRDARRLKDLQSVWQPSGGIGAVFACARRLAHMITARAISQYEQCHQLEGRGLCPWLTARSGREDSSPTRCALAIAHVRQPEMEVIAPVLAGPHPVALPVKDQPGHVEDGQPHDQQDRCHLGPGNDAQRGQGPPEEVGPICCP